MAINVLNTNASLSGKTITVNENADTVTGLKTFDRDPSAPFAVSSGSAVVPNLDADKLDGLNAIDWTAWTPELTNITIGSGTVVARYAQLGDLVLFWFRITLAADSSMGTDPQVSLPVAINDTLAGVGVDIGHGLCIETGVQNYIADARIVSATAVRVSFHQVSGAVIIPNAVSSIGPFTWGDTDVMDIRGSYQAAAAL